ncbi:MAG: FimV/HubP family polar landmark protein, partial [Gammaproteobacteria bacterium]
MRIRLACAAGLLLPTTVLALGLGPMQTNSSLLEPFEAKIPLVDAKVEELDTLKVGLANRAQFKRAGLEFALVLSDLRFELVQPKAGNDYVRIWSKEPVREPVLDFLLEVNWSNGRLIREFTVLLDPPRYGSTSSVAPHRPAATASAWPRPTKSSPRDTTPDDTSDQYGPTQAGDALWEIARGIRGDISVQQMMIALLQANPNAFIDANINRLKQGQILRIPDAAALSSRTQAEALAEVRRHNALWEQYRQRLASSVPERSVGAEGSQGTVLDNEQDGKQVPPAEQARLEVLGAAGSAAEKPQDSAAGKGEGAGPETEQLVAEESEAVTQDENSHLRERLKESESLVELMGRQVQLKDDELAALQAKLAQTGTAAPEGIEKPPGDAIEEQPEGTPQAAGAEAGEETASSAVAPPQPQAAVTDTPTGPVATEPVSAAPAAAGGATPETAAPSEQEKTAPSAGAEPLVAEPSIEAQQGAETTDEATAPPAADSQEMVSTEEAQPGQAPSASVDLGGELGEVTPPSSETPQEGAQVVDSAPVEGAPLIPGGIYSVIGLIAAAGMIAFWVFWRIRAKSQGAKDEEELTVEVPSPLAGVSGFAGTEAEEEEGRIAERTLDIQEHAYDVDAVIEDEAERTRFPTEIPAEKDPLEEVNVCIAYERFDEAEQLVKKAIAVQPRRHDYKLRLLEVYYAAGNKGAYERAARDLSAAVGGEGPLWDNAIAMWYEMSPERPLFAEKPREEDHRDEMESQREVLDITSVSDAEPWKSESSPERAGLKMASTLDFDLGTTQDKELAAPISARGGSEEQPGEYTDVFDLSSPEDAASEGIVDVTAVAEGNADDAQMLDLTVAENTLGAEDILDLTAVDSEKGVDQDMLDLTVADSTANADEILDLTTTGSGYDDGVLDFDITGGHEVPEVTEDSEDALHLTVPKATSPSAKPPEPQEQVFQITSPTEGRGAENRSLEIGQETVELPNRNTRAAVAEQEDDGIQTVDLFHYFQKGGAAARSAGDSTAEPDTAESSAQGAVSEAADDSVALEKDFVVIADLTAPEDVVVINLADEVGGKTQDLDALEIQDNARFANTVRLPRAFPAAGGEPSDLDTKLNLAKAYIELGDPKGAREILDEVA